MLVKLYGADSSRMAVIPCGVDLRRFRPINRASARRSLGLDSSPVVLYVGRLEPLKGIDILIEAMAQLERSDALLLIVGGDAEAESELRRLQAQAIALGLEKRVRFIGAVQQSDLPRYYSAADVCVVPSYYESFGLVAVEAMACATPVVASRVGGLASTVSDGETGYLIPWRCPEPFAERIDLILSNDELRKNLGLAARRSMRRYGWERVTASLAAEYSRMWQERSTGAACHGVSGGYRPQHIACGDRS
jgi:D-inositol-3-phosphate glycosyltransferase